MATIPQVAVIIPCYNEAAAISEVVSAFNRTLPKAEVHVFDNDSLDNTAAVAKRAGAQVHSVAERGKGNVVRAMFRDIDVDYYIMVDGDGTYPAASAVELLALATRSNADMVIGNRMPSYCQSASRSGHFWGNRILTATVNYLFDAGFQDLFSGYRVLSRRFVKSIPIFSKGFEVETAMSIHAIEVDAKVLELPIDYTQRTAGTESKLYTLRDGLKISFSIFTLFKDYRPKVVYGGLALIFNITGLVIGAPVILEYIETGLVPRFPSAILASSLVILSFLSAFTGIVLSAIAKNRRELKKLSFLSVR